MGADLAASTLREHESDFLAFASALGKRLPPKEALEAVVEWARALRALPEPPPAKAPMRAKASADPAAAWIEQWAQAARELRVMSVYGDLADSSLARRMAEWAGVGAKALDALDELWRAWGSEPLPRAERLRLGVDDALARFARRFGGKRDPQEEAEIWLGLGAVPVGGFDGALGALVGEPAAWRAAASLAGRGGRAPAGSEKQLREWISAALSEGASGRHGIGAEERVRACQDLLAAGGWTMARYRSKNGGRFDEMALGAVWSWTDAKLAVELSKAGLVWSAPARAKAPEHAARMLAKSQMSGEAILGTLVAIDGGEGLGPWTPSMEKLGQRVATWRIGGVADQLWEEPFARWAVAGAWDAQARAAMAKACPSLAKSGPWRAACEARELAESVGSAMAEADAPRRRARSAL